MALTQTNKFYPSMILLLIIGFLIFLGWSAFQATNLGSRVTDTDYYSKGLKYNSTMVEKKAAEVLGWKVQTFFDGRIVTFLLIDSMGGSVNGANGTLYMTIPGKAENIHLPLQESEPGRYRVSLGETVHGTIQTRLELEREGVRLNRQLLLNLW